VKVFNTIYQTTIILVKNEQLYTKIQLTFNINCCMANTDFFATGLF